MKITKTLHVTTRAAWRAWLRKHHRREREVWLLYYKKDSGRPRIPYDDAVEEALCFGWIDSTVQTIDATKYTQRYTPRRDGSAWSPSNIERMRRLIREGRMTKAGLEKFDPSAKPAPRPEPVLPAAVERALRTNRRAWANLQNLAPSYRRGYVAWLASAKTEETRERRLKEALSLLERNLKLGMK